MASSGLIVSSGLKRYPKGTCCRYGIGEILSALKITYTSWRDLKIELFW